MIHQTRIFRAAQYADPLVMPFTCAVNGRPIVDAYEAQFAASLADDQAIENRDLKLLREFASAAKPLFDDFLDHLRLFGFQSLLAFVQAPASATTGKTISAWLSSKSGAKLYDGTGIPYDDGKGRWLFICWLLREAAEQRLAPLATMLGSGSKLERYTLALDRVRAFAGSYMAEEIDWSWPVVREVIATKLEGSRRAKIGHLLETSVRGAVADFIAYNGYPLQVSATETKVGTYTIDIVVTSGSGRALLIPVKTLKTTGGGHAILFHREVEKALLEAKRDGDAVLPVYVSSHHPRILKEIEEEAVILHVHPEDLRLRGLLMGHFMRQIEKFAAIL